MAEENKIKIAPPIPEVTKEEEIDTCDKLEKGIFTLLENQPFVGHLVQLLTRRISRKFVPTACVSVYQHRYTLTVNPDFFNELSPSESAAIVTHEVYHLLNEHLKRCEGKDMRLFNCAADMAINQYIPDLPKFDREKKIKELFEKFTKVQNEMKAKGEKIEKEITKEDIEKLFPAPDKNGKCSTCLLPQNYGMPLEKTAEWYYEAIQKDKNLRDQFGKKKMSIKDMTPEEQKQLAKDIKDGKVQIQIGDGSHEDWDTTEGETPEVLDEELKHIIREAMESARKDFGKLPAGMQQTINEMLESKINWRAELRNFVQVATRVLRVHSRKRPSRRFGWPFDGQRSDFKLNLGVVIDTSGSISDEELKLFLGEIHRINETGLADITVMEADAAVHRTYKFNKKMGKTEAHRFYGRGGTDAAPWLKALEEGKYDAGIILTDGYFQHQLTKPRHTAVLWALTAQGYQIKDFHAGVAFGKKIKLELEKKYV